MIIKQVLIVFAISFFSFGELIITEINPAPSSSECEWFELKNCSNSPQLLSEFYFSTKEEFYKICDKEIYLGTGEFVVVVEDSGKFKNRFPAEVLLVEPQSWATLYNGDGFISLKNHGKTVSDSIFYSSSWFESWQNETLIRTDENRAATEDKSWAKSSLPTPGFPNEEVKTKTNSSSFTASPFPFSPDGDCVNDDLIIAINLDGSQTASLTIVGLGGEVFWKKEKVETGKTVWNGIKTNGNPAPIGPFFLFLECSSGKLMRTKGVLWRN